jgi:hypothetical protein
LEDYQLECNFYPFRKVLVSMNIDDLKRLAGVTDFRGKPTHMEPINRSGITAKPGTDEWFKAMFPVNDMQMPVGFRGRKK